MLSSFLSNDFFIPLVTERLVLKMLSQNEKDRLVELVDDLRVTENLARVPHPYSLQDAKDYIQQCQTDLTAGTDLALGIYLRSNNQLIGSIGITSSGELGYWLGYAYWGQGFGTEAAKVMIEFAFLTLKLSQLKASAKFSNTTSQRILSSLGFKETGTIISTSLAKEGQFPSISYLLLREEFIKSIPESLPIIMVVAVALRDDQDRILLAQRPGNKSMSGLWEFPGGKIETNETPEKALQRELKEELNISVKEEDFSPITFLSYPYDKFHLCMLLYNCQAWEGNLEGKEGQEISWVKKSELKNYLTLPANISLFSFFICNRF